MLDFATLDSRMELMARMADTVGADIVAAVEADPFRASVIRVATLRCMMCEHATTCAAWLEAEKDQNPQSAPAFCANRQVLSGMTRRMQA